MAGTTPPTAVSDAAGVTEDGRLTTTGNVLANDTDPSGLALSVTAVNGVTISGTTTIVGVYGTMVIQANGQYTYTLANTQANVRALADQQLVIDRFTYTISDGQTYTQTSSRVQQNFITQSEAFDAASWSSFSTSGTAPVIVANTDPGPTGGASTADKVTLSSASSGLYTTTNISGQYTFSVYVRLISGSGAFSFNYYNGASGADGLQTATATSLWQRLSWTFTGGGNAGSNVALMLGAGQGTAGTFEFWGAQLNSGAAPLTYVATTGVAINTTATVTTPVVVSSALSVTVTGSVPVANPDTASVTRNGTLTSSGNVLGNDTDGAGLPLSILSVNGISISGSTTIVGIYGTLVILANGQYTYTLANSQANVLGLSSGQTATDRFTYTVSDGRTHTQTITQLQQNLINQSEAFDSSSWTSFANSGTAPVIVANTDPGPSGTASTADTVTLSSANSGLYTTTGVAGQYTFSVYARLISGSGAFSFNYYNAASNVSSLQTATATGAWQRLSWTFTGSGNASSNVALMLAAGQGTAGTFEFWGAQLNSGATALAYTATTGSPINTTTTSTVDTGFGAALSVTVVGAGTNTPPTAVSDAAGVTEDGRLTTTGNVLANDTDPSGLALSVIAVNGVTISGTTTIVGVYGTMVIQANGQYTYTLANTQANVRALADQQLVVDKFTYTISDGQTYTQTSSQVQQNFIAQSEAFDAASWSSFSSSGTAPVIVANTDPGPTGAASTADKVTLSSASSGLYTTTNVSGQYTFSVYVRLISGSGAFSFNYYNGASGADGLQTATATSLWQRLSWTFTGGGNAGSNVALMLGAGQGTAGTFEFWGAQLNSGAAPLTYVATTGVAINTTATVTTPVVVSSALSVTVTGSVPVANPDTASITVGSQGTATGGLLSNDTGATGIVLSVSTVNGQTISGSTTIVGVYGTMVVQANGQYTYTLNNGLLEQALVGGEVEQDVFAYTVSDGRVHTVTGTVVNQNLITQSEAFDNAVWTRFAQSGGTAPAITANVDPGPNRGAATADIVTLTSASSGIAYLSNVSGQYTFSVWVRLISGNANFAFNYYSAAPNLSYTQAAIATTAWQRLSWVIVGDANGASNVALMHSATQSTTGTFEFWGAELNSGGTPDAYVATTGAAVSITSATSSVVTPGSTLNVAVTGNDAAQAGPALNLQSTIAGVVANLATGQWTVPLKIMPFGDSITHGWIAADWSVQGITTDQGYRGPLWRSFVTHQALVNFVGDQVDGPATLPDGDNAGYPGFTTAQLLAKLPDLLAVQQPGAVLLEAGANDLLQGIAQATIIANLTSMIDRISAANAATQIYIGTVTPLTAVSTTTESSLNAAIATMVKQEQAAGDKVVLVDMSNITTDDLIFDGTHPNDVGYGLMAQNFFAAILAQQPIQAGTPGGIVNTISSATVNIIGGSGNDLLIGDTRNNIINGGAGNDVLMGGGGNDTLIGGPGADQFDISAIAGTVSILDFLPSQGDMLVWDHIKGLTGTASLSGHYTQTGGQTVVNLSSFGTSLQVTLANYTGDLSHSIFLST